jgi:hypothetical protein
MSDTSEEIGGEKGGEGGEADGGEGEEADGGEGGEKGGAGQGTLLHEIKKNKNQNLNMLKLAFLLWGRGKFQYMTQIISVKVGSSVVKKT